MTPVGRILILPKGRYDADTVYNMLDLVMHNGTSWLAKKTVVNIEPSEENVEYWQKLVDVDDAIDHGIEEFFGSGDSTLPLTIPSLTLYNADNAVKRGSLAIDEQGLLVFEGNTIFHSLNLDNYLNEYLREHLNDYMTEHLDRNSYGRVKMVSYVGTGKYGIDNACSLTFDFAPTMLKMVGFKNTDDSSLNSTGVFYCTLANSDIDALDFIICDELSTEYENYKGFCAGHNDGTHLNYCKKSEDGKTISWYADRASYQCSVAGCTYYVLAIG